MHEENIFWFEKKNNKFKPFFTFTSAVMEMCGDLQDSNVP